jgi:uncharacterized spore protein YtfJ
VVQEVVAMGFRETIKSAEEALSVRRVFGEPYEKNGLTFIPAARLRGGAGGGGGTGPEGSGDGEGSGFGLTARPVGAYVIRGESVQWQPAIDVNRIVLGGQIVALFALFALRAIVRVRSKRR